MDKEAREALHKTAEFYRQGLLDEIARLTAALKVYQDDAVVMKAIIERLESALAESQEHAGKCVDCGAWTCGFCGMHDDKSEWRCKECHHGRHVCYATEQLETLEAENADLRAKLEATEKDKESYVLEYRKILWLGHGHAFHCLYGDDGEMQCHVCGQYWDYKRHNLIDLTVQVLAILRERAEAAEKRLKPIKEVWPWLNGHADLLWPIPSAAHMDKIYQAVKEAVE